MRKSTIATFFIINVIMVIVGVGLIIAGAIGSSVTQNSAGQVTSGHIGNPALFAVGVIIVVLSGIPYLVAWIGALVNLARLQRWVWFVLVFIFHWIAVLVYLIAGPTTPSGPPPLQQYQQYPQYMPPQSYPQPRSDLPPQPPQNYPQP
jgi:hypothetical protein